MSPLWGFLKTAATNIPWSKSAPIIVELLGRARDRMKQHDAGQKSLDDHLRLLQEENARLTEALVQVSENLQQVTARVSLLTKLTALSLLVALASLGLWIAR